MGLVELGQIMMMRSERHLEITSQNITNVATPGYKRTIAFDEIIDAAPRDGRQSQAIETGSDFAQGSLRQTGRPLDVGLSGAGFFRLRAEDGRLFYTRNGQFSRDSEGRVVNSAGYTLQLAGGGDLSLDHDGIEVLNDGTVLDNGAPVARIGVFAPDQLTAMRAEGGSLFTSAGAAMHEVTSPLVRQGALEGANVDNAAEMLQMMSSMREAEAGARIVATYDALLGQSIQTFGR